MQGNSSARELTRNEKKQKSKNCLNKKADVKTQNWKKPVNKVTVLCEAAQCSVVDTNRCFGTAYCLHHQEDE
jgi:hypothetical protein